MSNPRYFIVPHGDSCALHLQDIHVATRLILPIPADEARALINAAFRGPDQPGRAEFCGVLADKTPTGIRVHVVAKPDHMEIPWTYVAQGLDIVETSK